MAASRKRSRRRRHGGFVRRHRGHIGRGIVKGVIVFYLVVMILAGLLDVGTDHPPYLTSLLIFMFLVASLLYLFFVSSQVWLQLPGINVRRVRPEDKTAADERGTGRRARGRRNDADALAERDAVVGTIQVTRLSAQAPEVIVANDSFLPVLRAKTSFQLVRENEDGSVSGDLVAEIAEGEPFSLPAHGRRHFSVSRIFDHVGIFVLSSPTVRVWDLVGLFSREHGLPGQWRVRVVPNIYRLTQGIPRNRKVRQASLGVPDAPADALDYDRVRDYRPGDPLKTIHWKLVAHGQGELYTKLFETSTASMVTVLFDPYGPAPLTTTLATAYHLYDTMLEGAFSLIEHARQSGIPGRLRFVNRNGSLVEASWEGWASLGWFVETARRPSHAQEALEQSVMSIQSMRDANVGYLIFATSRLTDTSVSELLACRTAGIPLLVVHALPGSAHSDYDIQNGYDNKLRRASIDVIALSDGPQIVREVAAS